MLVIYYTYIDHEYSYMRGCDCTFVYGTVKPALVTTSIKQ